MTRHTLTSTALAALLIAPGIALAESPQASTGTGSEVASQAPKAYDTNSPAIRSGVAEIDPLSIGMEQAVFDAVLAAPGKDIESTGGEMIGVIEAVDVNPQGNPELIVDLSLQSDIPADVLVVTVQPGTVALIGDVLALETSVEALEQRARYNSGRDSDDRVSVTLF